MVHVTACQIAVPMVDTVCHLFSIHNRFAPTSSTVPAYLEITKTFFWCLQATGFFNWRCSRACEQQAVASHKAQLQNYLAGPAPDVSGAVPPAPATAARKADKASARS